MTPTWEELSNRMFLDVYMREIGGNCYMLVQIYSGDQVKRSLLLSQMQPYAGGGWSYTEAGGWQYLHGDGTFGTQMNGPWTRTAYIPSGRQRPNHVQSMD